MPTDRFRYKKEFEAFLASVTGDNSAFNVIDVPPFLWPNLYLVKIANSQLIVRVAGEALRDAFQRDLRGIDLLKVAHGPNAETIQKGYSHAMEKQQRIVMRQLIYFEEKRMTRIIECGFVPLIADGVVHRLVGCLFFDSLREGEDEYGASEFYVEEIA